MHQIVEDIDEPAGAFAAGRAALAESRLSRLPDGRVLVAGGVFGARRATLAELWDPVTGAWRRTEDSGPEEVPGLALLDDGEVLLVGAERTRIFNPSTLRWRRIADLNHQQTFGSTVVLGDGRVMVVGGEGTAADNEVAV